MLAYTLVGATETEASALSKLINYGMDVYLELNE